MMFLRVLLFLLAYLTATFILGFIAAATAAPRAYVLLGQGSVVTSAGMIPLASDVRKLGVITTIHNWNAYGDVVASIRKLTTGTPVVIIGYSLGANATTWISNAVGKRKIALIVAYDPSIWSAVRPAGSNVNRLLLYRNGGPSPWGHARIPGSMVETTETLMPHLAVPFSARLHELTLKAVAKLVR